MVELLLFSFAESLLSKLASGAVQEASLALGVHGELQQMQATMALIRGVLLDAEQKNPQSNALGEWLRQIKQVVSDAEDIVDDFECEALRKHVVNTYGGCSRKVRRFFSTSNPLLYRLRMAHQIQDINTRWATLATQRSIFGLQVIDQDTRVVHVREMTHSHVKPSSITGREHDKNEIDTHISAVDVSMLWGALGFLPPSKQGESMTDIATQLLRELWTRSFLLDFVDLEGHCYFKLHDLVSDLAVFVGKGEFERIDHSNPKISENVQHLAFEENNFYGETLPPTNLRTLIFRNGVSNKDLLNTLLSRCKSLRILDLQNCEYESLPRCIGKLKHLRFLCLAQNEKLKQLPDSLCKLQNLQTLTLSGCIKLQMLPKGIENLINLRHLAITTAQTTFPEEVIGKLSSLEKLYIIDCDNLESLFEEVKLFTFKTFYLYNCGSLKWVSFHAIRNLEVLVIKDCDNLDLSFGLGSRISNSRLKYVVFSDLPQLVTLPRWLQGCANTLRSLLIKRCMNLKEFPDWLPTLIHVRVLEIAYCPNLLSFPVHHLTNLEDLHITGCPELSKRFHPTIGLDWHKISHIKRVHISSKFKNKQSPKSSQK
ncbi:disease resistance protein RPM1 [Vigna unguiculata]|uniref:Disease resistance protein RPM1 n=1 Tax=Vigna unguiculata TaxID=3917 RepID=A0A4D6MUV1_VIGUN|nr:disease resistance protein RPM1 [Vigna unguiculata]